MTTYTVTLSDVENLALSYVTQSQHDWIDNAAHARCRAAIDEIVQIAISKCLETGAQIPSSKEEIVSLAFANEWVKTATQQKADADAAFAAQIAAEQAAQQQG